MITGSAYPQGHLGGVIGGRREETGAKMRGGGRVAYLWEVVVRLVVAGWGVGGCRKMMGGRKGGGRGGEARRERGE